MSWPCSGGTDAQAREDLRTAFVAGSIVSSRLIVGAAGRAPQHWALDMATHDHDHYDDHDHAGQDTVAMAMSTHPAKRCLLGDRHRARHRVRRAGGDRVARETRRCWPMAHNLGDVAGLVLAWAGGALAACAPMRAHRRLQARDDPRGLHERGAAARRDGLAEGGRRPAACACRRPRRAGR